MARRAQALQIGDVVAAALDDRLDVVGLRRHGLHALRRTARGQASREWLATEGLQANEFGYGAIPARVADADSGRTQGGVTTWQRPQTRRQRPYAQIIEPPRDMGSGDMYILEAESTAKSIDTAHLFQRMAGNM